MLFNYDPPVTSPLLGENDHWLDGSFISEDFQSKTNHFPSPTASQVTMFSQCQPPFCLPSTQSELTLSMELFLDEVPIAAKESLIDFISNMGLKPCVDRTDGETIVTVNVSKLTDTNLKNRFIEHLKKYTDSYRVSDSKIEEAVSDITVQDVIELTRNQTPVRFSTASIQVSQTDLTSSRVRENCVTNNELILKPSPLSMPRPNDWNSSNPSIGAKNKKRRRLTSFLKKFKRKPKKTNMETTSSAVVPQIMSKNTSTSVETASLASAATKDEFKTNETSCRVTPISKFTHSKQNARKKLKKQSTSLPSFVNHDIEVNTSLWCPHNDFIKVTSATPLNEETSRDSDQQTFGIFGQRESQILLSKKRIVLRGSDTKYASILHGDKDFQKSFEPLNQFKSRPRVFQLDKDAFQEATSTASTSAVGGPQSDAGSKTRFLKNWWSSTMDAIVSTKPEANSNESIHFTDSMSDLTEGNCMRVLTCWNSFDMAADGNGGASWWQGNRDGVAGTSDASHRRRSRFDDKIEVKAVKYLINSIFRIKKQ